MLTVEGHLLSSDDFKYEQLEAFFAKVFAIKNQSKTITGRKNLQTLQHKGALLYFAQSSTRTFYSFKRACQILGVQTAEYRDSSLSSESKGETQDDTFHTLAQYYDLLITRTWQSKIPYDIAAKIPEWGLQTKVINAGNGMEEHPTQALLDVYTLWEIFNITRNKKMDGLKICVVGDLLRGRAAKSFVKAVSIISKAHFIFLSPTDLRFSKESLSQFDLKNISYEVSDDFDSAVSAADVIYMTRMQDEYLQDKQKQAPMYGLNRDNIKHVKSDAIILHPLPRREEICPSIDNTPQAYYWQQEANGLWVRVALIQEVLKN